MNIDKDIILLELELAVLKGNLETVLELIKLVKASKEEQ